MRPSVARAECPYTYAAHGSSWPGLQPQPSGDGQHLTVTRGPPRGTRLQDQHSPQASHLPSRAWTPAEHLRGFHFKGERGRTGPNNQSSGRPHRIDRRIIGAGGNLRGH